ncbi:hypothetical protein BT96DRAFT_873427 [Gymnopus androsaceus JB14]|uniref:LysM domain-containing protein n=1 Tax=Gymnopus androsaceus JB14 TaxID=1447944 RepID=A0A6A4IJQ4_9AGAR|nr:hypothetical protein BT96DRAFT_873427 [Gymnopus androsaceus JB14]
MMYYSLMLQLPFCTWMGDACDMCLLGPNIIQSHPFQNPTPDLLQSYKSRPSILITPQCRFSSSPLNFSFTCYPSCLPSFHSLPGPSAFGSMTHFNVFAQNSTCATNATNYTVQQGDVCSTIASKFNITITDLEAANPVINSGCTNLAIGEVYFNVFAQNSTCATNYTVQQGDQCAAIASKFNITNADLHAANPVINTNCTNLAIGEVCISLPPPRAVHIIGIPNIGTLRTGCSCLHRSILSGPIG